MTKITITLLLCLLPISLPAQVNPLEGDNAAIRLGRALFGARCSTCHGADAKGIVAPDLTALWASEVDDERVFQVIRQGVPGSVMPPSQAPDTELWSIVAYLKSISTVPDMVLSGGDPARGRQLFHTRCAECHRVNGQGGSLGPDLSRITRIRSRSDIVSAIRQPDTSVARGYRTVRLVTGNGDTVEGLLKAEDAFSVQILDRDQRLRGFRLADIRSLERSPDSLMPAFDDSQLNDAAIDDLLQYLAATLSDSSFRGTAP
jgi:putative heme-binding domain-containing protein